MSDSDVVIRVEGLGKKYALHHEQPERYRALRDSIAHRARAAGKLLNPFTLAGQLRRAQRHAVHERQGAEEEFWALKDVSFEIRRGERVGIIGRNGAGKSTLLKILSRITEPTTGRVEIRGRVASLLEVGTGFHPELTGRENIYLNGAILGMTRREIKSKFDEIVDFAEVEKFLDTPVKRYSSGMYVRLAFAVAAHLEPEILVVDEVLAVGDASFQRKCLKKMQETTEEHRTLLFVSHDLSAIQTLCPSTLLLGGGRLAGHKDTQKAIQTYLGDQAGSSGEEAVDCGNFTIKSRSIRLATPGTLEISFSIKHGAGDIDTYFAFDVKRKRTGICIGQAFTLESGLYRVSVMEHNLSFNVTLPKLIPGPYLVFLWAGRHNDYSFIDEFFLGEFEVMLSPTRGRTFPHTDDHGCIVLPVVIQQS